MEMRPQKIFAGLTTMRFFATEDTEKTEDILEIEFRGSDNTEFFATEDTENTEEVLENLLLMPILQNILRFLRVLRGKKNEIGKL